MPKVKTHSLLAVVKGHERSDKVFGERFMNSIRSDCEDAIADNFLGVGVEIAGYTHTCICGENTRREARLATAAWILSRWKGDLATWEGGVWIMWSSFGGRVEAGGLRVLENKIQGCSEVVEGGGGRRARR